MKAAEKYVEFDLKRRLAVVLLGELLRKLAVERLYDIYDYKIYI